jgi:hypothetical protein
VLAPQNKCWAQAIGNGIFELASVFWTGTIALTLYRLVWRRERLEVVEKSLPRLFAFVFGVPTLLTLLPFLQGSHVYGPSGGHATWCWIKPQYPAWVFVCFYVPLWCTMLFNLVVHLRTMVRLKGIQAQGLGAAAEEGGGLDASTSARFQLILQRLSWYPFILIIVWGPASVNRVLEAISGGKDSFFVLYFLQRVFSSSQGLLNAIAYGLTRGVREALLKDLHPYLPSWCHERFAGGGSASAGDGAGEAAGSASGAALALRPASTTTLANSGSSSLLGSASAQHSVDAGSIHVHGSSLPGAPVEEDDEDVVVAPPRAREGL